MGPAGPRGLTGPQGIPGPEGKFELSASDIANLIESRVRAILSSGQNPSHQTSQLSNDQNKISGIKKLLNTMPPVKRIEPPKVIPPIQNINPHPIVNPSPMQIDHLPIPKSVTKKGRKSKKSKNIDDDFLEMQARRGPRMSDRTGRNLSDYVSQIDKANRKKKDAMIKSIKANNNEYRSQNHHFPTISDVENSPPRKKLSDYLKNKGQPRSGRIPQGPELLARRNRQKPMKSKVSRERTIKKAVKEIKSSTKFKKENADYPMVPIAGSSKNEKITGIKLSRELMNIPPSIDPRLRDILQSKSGGKMKNSVSKGKLAQKFLTTSRSRKIAKLKKSNSNNQSKTLPMLTYSPKSSEPAQKPSTPKNSRKREREESPDVQISKNDKPRKKFKEE